MTSNSHKKLRTPCKSCLNEDTCANSVCWRRCPVYLAWFRRAWPIITGLFTAGEEDDTNGL